MVSDKEIAALREGDRIVITDDYWVQYAGMIGIVTRQVHDGAIRAKINSGVEVEVAFYKEEFNLLDILYTAWMREWLR